LLIAVPAFFVWTLAGALAPPSEGGVSVASGVSQFLPVVTFGVVAIAVLRSACQLVAIAMFSTSTKLSVLDRSSTFDPGNYRIHTRVAQAYVARGDCKRARPHAHAARDLFPSASEPRREIAACGGR